MAKVSGKAADRLRLETATRAADLALLELDFARGSQEGLMILGEALETTALSVYESGEAGTSFHPLLSWSPGDALNGTTAVWDNVAGSPAAEIHAMLAGRSTVHVHQARARELFPADSGPGLVLVPLQASGRLVGFLAAAFSAEVSGYREGALASFALSLSAAMAKSRAEKATLKAVAEEDAARRASALLLARVGHELRTPLVALDGIASLLEEKGETMDPERRKEALRYIREGGKRLLRLVEEVLALSRIDAGLRRIDPRPLDFTLIAGHAEHLMAGLLAGKPVTFRARLAPELPAAFIGDEEGIEEILDNLLGNAAKYSASGSIELEIRPAGDGRLSFTLRDEGVGMDETALARISEPFHATKAGLSGERGSGLGLSIVTSLARLLGGEFSLESEKGKGTTARLVIPRLG